MTAGLDPALERLYVVLQRLRVPAIEALQPGLPGEAIERLLRPVPHAIPPDVITLYHWRNGVGPTAANQDLLPGGAFMPLADAVAEYRLSIDAAREVSQDTDLNPDDLYDSHWFPLFIDAAGNPHVVVLGDAADAGAVWYVLREDSAQRRLVGQSIAQVVEIVTRRWQDGVYYLDRATGIPMADLAALAAERRAADEPQLDVPRLVHDLTSPDAQASARSLRLLKEYLFPEAVGPLIGLLRAADPRLRTQAASLLGQIGDPAAIPGLEAIQRDPDDVVRGNVEWALRELRRRRQANRG